MSVCSKLISANGALAKLRYFVPPKTLTSVCHAIFNSHLNYGNQIWGQNPNSVTDIILILQKSMISIMCKVPRCIHADPLFYNFRILFDQINVLFYILKNKVPESGFETFTLMLHSHNTRSNSQIIFLQINTSFWGIYSIKYQCIDAWNHCSNIFTPKNYFLLQL